MTDTEAMVEALAKVLADEFCDSQNDSWNVLARAAHLHVLREAASRYAEPYDGILNGMIHQLESEGGK